MGAAVILTDYRQGLRMAPGCGRGKTLYATRLAATTARQKLIAEERGSFDLKVYHCPACGGFHLGRKARG